MHMSEVCGLAVFAQVQARLVALQQKAAGMTRPVNKERSPLGFSFRAL
jgi:hypothetical protein